MDFPNLYRPDMTPEERRLADEKHTRVRNFALSKLQYLPEHHKEDIRKVFSEEFGPEFDAWLVA